MDAPTLASLARQWVAGFGFGMLFQMGLGPVSLAVIHKAINAGSSTAPSSTRSKDVSGALQRVRCMRLFAFLFEH